MMSFNNIKKDPEILLENNIYRWNHDKKHDAVKDNRKFRCRYHEIEVKSIFKPKKFKQLTHHFPNQPTENNIIVVNSINTNPETLGYFYSNLREYDIRNARLICYHYRITSIEHIHRKIKNNKITHYQYNNIVNQMKQFDYPELKDYTLYNKSKIRYGNSK